MNTRTMMGIAMVAVMVIPATSQAIPAWARKYSLDCSSCHFGGTNRLTKFGKEFQVRGDRLASDASETEIKELNLSNYMSLAGKFRFNADKDAVPSTNFDVEALSIYSGGALYDNYSYFFEYYLHEPGKETSSTGGQIDTATRGKLAEMYLLYNSNPEGENYTFVRAGQITPRLIHHASTGARISISRPNTWNDNAGGGNLYTPRDRSYGVTVGTHNPSGLIGEIGVLNGGGGNSRPNQPENNNAKDFFASASQFLDEEGSYIGAYAYNGTYPITGTSPFQDKFSRYAILGEFIRGDFVVSGAYSWGQNTLAAGGHRNPKAHYVEAGFNVSPISTLFARYDFFDSDLTASKTAMALGFSQRLSHLGRWAIEGQQVSPKGGTKTSKLTFELNWMF